jgi:hypothetical protein
MYVTLFFLWFSFISCIPLFRLNGTYELPKLPVPPPSSGKGKSGEAKKRTSILGSFLPNSNKEEVTTTPERKEERSSSKESVKKEQLLSPPSSSASSNRNSVPLSNSVSSTPHNQNDIEDDVYSEMRTTIAPAERPPTALQLTELLRETIVNDFLIVSVMKGDMVVKKKDDSKKHHGYLVS